METYENYLILSGGEASKYCFFDLETDERIISFQRPYLPVSRGLEFLRHVHIGDKTNLYGYLPLKYIWKGTSVLPQINFTQQKKYRILFTNGSVSKISLTYLKQLKKNYQIEYFLYMVDSVSAMSGKVALPYINADLFERIFSFDENDVAKFNFEYYAQPISSFPNQVIPSKSSDLFFIGRTKGRLDDLISLHEKLSQVNHKFLIVPSNTNPLEKKILMEQGLFSEQISYIENIEYVQNTNCLLEIVQDGQVGNTLRYQEAIMYNKKLLTNNPQVMNLPYYDPRYIRVFKTVEEIDPNWIKHKEAVEYGYQGEFSAIRLLDLIISGQKLESQN